MVFANNPLHRYFSGAPYLNCIRLFPQRGLLPVIKPLERLCFIFETVACLWLNTRHHCLGVCHEDWFLPA
jgi:hypothetical protein